MVVRGNYVKVTVDEIEWITITSATDPHKKISLERLEEPYKRGEYKYAVRHSNKLIEGKKLCIHCGTYHDANSRTCDNEDCVKVILTKDEMIAVLCKEFKLKTKNTLSINGKIIKP